mmetsp:Transcript_55988/g.149354  ORF Transcript_55988/g.149354 Transcript_55988/m.149354 type:complete len:205 (+) Transcript_55988:1046-1660(+)
MPLVPPEFGKKLLESFSCPGAQPHLLYECCRPLHLVDPLLTQVVHALLCQITAPQGLQPLGSPELLHVLLPLQLAGCKLLAALPTAIITLYIDDCAEKDLPASLLVTLLLRGTSGHELPERTLNGQCGRGEMVSFLTGSCSALTTSRQCLSLHGCPLHTDELHPRLHPDHMALDGSGGVMFSERPPNEVPTHKTLNVGGRLIQL